MPEDAQPNAADSEPARPDDERELIRRCLEGDASAFEPLVERYRQRVWRLAYQILRDREEAWDCAQEAFVRAFHSLPSFRGQSAFYTWLFRITVNIATDRQRARGAQARAFGAERVPEEEWRRIMPDPGSGPDRVAVQAEQRERIQKALDALPPKARTIIMLSDLEGLSYREIADVLRCPIGTVMSRLHNARKRLKALLGPMLGALIIALAVALAGTAPAAAQPLIRFGVRVLYASNPTAPDSGAPSAQNQKAPKSSNGPPAGPAPAPAGPPPPPPRPLSPMPPPPGQAAPPHVTSPMPPPPGPDSDERLQRILPKLRALFRYNEYTPIERHRVDGALGAAQRFSIPGDRWLEVTPDQFQGTALRMHVRLLRGERPEMNAMLLASPGAPAIFGGPAYANGVLIIILWVNPSAPSNAPPPAATAPPDRPMKRP